MFSLPLLLILLLSTDIIFSENHVSRLRVEEKSLKGTLVGEIDCPSFSKGEILLAGRAADLFRIQNTSVFVEANIDGDTICSEFMVDNKCVVPLQLHSNIDGVCDMLVEIIDKDDNPPVFETAFPNLTIFELEVVGKTWILPIIKDADFSANPEDVTYSLIDSSSNVKRITNVFILKSSVPGSPPMLQLNSSLDYETEKEYLYHLFARDKHGQEATLPIRILIADSNDNAPIFKKSYITIRINESHPDLSTSSQNQDVPAVITVTATDADSGPNGMIDYSLSTKNKNHLTYLSINSSTGSIYLKQHLNARQVDKLVVKVGARDHGYPALSSTCTVHIDVVDENDHAPQISLQQFQHQLEENSDISVAVGIVTATDEDKTSNGNLTCSLHEKSVNDFMLSLILGTSSSKVVYYLYAQRSFDRETEPEVLIELVCSDHGRPRPHETFKNITITILDVNEFVPVLGNPTLYMEVSENAPLDTTLFPPFTFTDEDASQNHSLSIFDPSNKTAQYFTIDQMQRVLKTQGLLDREVEQAFHFYVIVTDHGRPTLQATATVHLNILDENDNQPIFLSSSDQWVVENSMNSTLVFEVRDLDLGDNGRVRWQVVPEEGGEPGLFMITDQSQGVLHISRPLDREAQSTYRFHLLISDYGKPHALTTRVPVTLHVLDENDNGPVWSHPYATNVTFINVTAPMAAFSPLAVVRATDQDEGENGKISYRLSPDSETFFCLKVEEYATIYSRTLLQDGAYTITVLAVDGSEGSAIRHTATTSIKIYVTASTVPPHKGNTIWPFIILLVVTVVLIILFVLWLRRHLHSSNNDKKGECSPPLATLNNKHAGDTTRRNLHARLHTNEDVLHPDDLLNESTQFESPLYYMNSSNLCQHTPMNTVNRDIIPEHLSESNLLLSCNHIPPRKLSPSPISNSDFVDSPHYTWTMMRPYRCTGAGRLTHNPLALLEEDILNCSDSPRIRTASGCQDCIHTGLFGCSQQDVTMPKSTGEYYADATGELSQVQYSKNMVPSVDTCASLAFMSSFPLSRTSRSSEFDVTLV